MNETTEDIVMVRVFGSDLAASGCGCGPGCCGSGDETDVRPLEEQVRNLEETLVRYYGPRVRVEYVDVFGEAMAAFPEMIKLIAERGLPLPLVAVNGEAKFAGGLPLDGISAEVEALGISPVENGI